MRFSDDNINGIWVLQSIYLGLWTLRVRVSGLSLGFNFLEGGVARRASCHLHLGLHPQEGAPSELLLWWFTINPQPQIL